MYARGVGSNTILFLDQPEYRPKNSALYFSVFYHTMGLYLFTPFPWARERFNLILNNLYHLTLQWRSLHTQIGSIQMNRNPVMAQSVTTMC